MASSAILEFAEEGPGSPATPQRAGQTPSADAPAVFGPSPRARVTAIGTVIALHAVGLTGALAHKVVVSRADTPEVIELLDISAPPTPREETPEITLETPPVVIPPPVFEIENRPPTITAVVSEEPPPPQPATPVATVVTQAPASAGPPRAPAVVSGVDLSASMLEAAPPRYPLESRRQREQGTVVLDVLLAPDGLVERIKVHRSSGFARLDKSALDAVRRWRWSPMMRDGRAVSVHGLVEIPFVLGPAHRGSHEAARPDDSNG